MTQQPISKTHHMSVQVPRDMITPPQKLTHVNKHKKHSCLQELCDKRRACLQVHRATKQMIYNYIYNYIHWKGIAHDVLYWIRCFNSSSNATSNVCHCQHQSSQFKGYLPHIHWTDAVNQMINQMLYHKFSAKTKKVLWRPSQTRTVGTCLSLAPG